MKKTVKDMHGNDYVLKRKDRNDGKFIPVDGVLRLITYLKDREDADVYINKQVDVTNLIEYMKKKKEKNPDITYFHALAMAMAKTIYNRPKLNRFIVNHDCYEKFDVSLSFVAKVAFEDDSKEFLQMLKVEREDTIDDISRKIKEKVEKLRAGKMNDTDKDVNVLDKLPKPILGLVVWFLKKLDKHGKLPKSLASDLIYNSSVILSNLGSIHCGAIYHNITDFGTNGILVTFGEIKKVPMVVDGKVVPRDVIEIGATLDERIADGVYMSKSVNMVEHFLTHPELLEEAASEKLEETKPFHYE